MDVILYRILRPFVNLLFLLIYHPKIVGKNNIPKKGGTVLSGNHTSNLDWLLLIASTRRTVHFLCKDSLNKGLLGTFLRRVGIIFVNRKIHDKEALNSAIEELNKGKVIGIFPEGTINREKKEATLPFKIGSVKMAHDTDSVLVPFVITGKYKMFINDLEIEFLEPIKIGDDLTKGNDKLRKIIGERLEEKNGNIK